MKKKISKNGASIFITRTFYKYKIFSRKKKKIFINIYYYFTNKK